MLACDGSYEIEFHKMLTFNVFKRLSRSSDSSPIVRGKHSWLPLFAAGRERARLSNALFVGRERARLSNALFVRYDASKVLKAFKEEVCFHLVVY